MKEVRIEFENYLKSIIETYTKPTQTVLQNPSNLSDLGNKSRD